MRLTKATHKAVEYACKHFHYAKAVPVCTIGYNVYNGSDEWCGVVLFGRGANQHIGTDFQTVMGGALELVRVALNGKQECTSQAVAMSLKRLKKDCPFCRLVVSYADIDQKHLGTIYQATNWIYVGDSVVGESHSFMLNGQKRHERILKSTVNKMGLVATDENIRKVFGEGTVRFYSEGKRKYLFPLDKAMKKQIEPLRKPYPKTDENWHKIDRSQFKKQNVEPDNVKG